MSTQVNKKIKKFKKSGLALTIVGSILSFVFMSIIVCVIFVAFVSYVFSDLYNNCMEGSNHITKMLYMHITDEQKQNDNHADGINKYLKIQGQSKINLKELKNIYQVVINENTLVDGGILLYDNLSDKIGDLSLPAESTDFYQAGKEGKYGTSIEQIRQVENIVYTSPIILRGKEIGLLYGMENGLIESMPDQFKDTETTGITESYLLTDNNKMVAYSGFGNKDYDYTATQRKMIRISDDYELEVESVKEGFELLAFGNIFWKNKELKNIEMPTVRNEKVSFTKLLEGERPIEIARLWYKRPLGIANLYTWVQAKLYFEAKDLIKIVTAGVFTVLLLMVPFLVMLGSTISRIHNNKKMGKLLYLDSVTGYGNWLYFTERVKKQLKRTKNKSTQYAMVSFEMNKYRLLSDYYGAEFGTEVLETISKELSKHMRKNEVYARYAASEYALFLQYINDEEITNRVYQILEALASKINAKNISFVAGVYQIEDPKLSVDALNLIASGSKDSLNSTIETKVVMHSEVIRERQLKEKSIEDTMEAALQNKEFKVYLQPKYSPNTNELEGAEALVRWISPQKGFISPGEFIPTFEKNGFIKKLDDYMLEEVSKLQADWLKAGREIVPISVNISRIHFTNENLAEHIRDIVDKYELPHEYIELELTESAFFDDKESLLSTVFKLHEYGFLVSMDDFGTGYSSLNSLKDIPLDVIKLDGEFFRDVKDKQRGETVIKNTITMAKDLNMKIVAEGIETKEQVEFLDRQGCDLIQGYYFAKPMPVADFEKLGRVKEA